MARPFSELTKDFSPERREHVEQIKKRIRQRLSMDNRTRMIFWAVIMASGIFLLAYMLFTITPNTSNKKTLEVIDEYPRLAPSSKNCQVIRYTDETQRWHYFLQCP